MLDFLGFILTLALMVLAVNAVITFMDVSQSVIARAIAYTVEQPDDVDVNEVIVRPTTSSFQPVTDLTNLECQT